MNENCQFFRDTVERILSDTISTNDIHAAESRQFPQALFDALRDNGISTMMAPEAQGGIGSSLPEAMSILHAAGAAAAPGPIVETILGHALLGQAGVAVDGNPLSLVLLPEGLDASAETAAFDIPWGDYVEDVLLIMPQGEGLRLQCFGRTDRQMDHGADAAGEPRDHLRINPAASGRMFDLDLTYPEVLRQASLLRAAQMLGAMEWAFHRSAEYAMERKQFGREIGKFQVVQQMLADLADHVLASTVILESAGQSDGLVIAAAARSRVADATDAAIAITHQVHGAIGFSREYALNLRTRRLMAWRNDYGSVQFWRWTLGSSFLNDSRESFWPSITLAGSQQAVSR